MIEFILNEKIVSTNKPNGSLLLDFIRYEKCLTGTKIGCREGDCGACTVLLGEINGGKLTYRQITSCLTPLGNVSGKHVVTIEGLNMDELTPVQEAIIKQGGTQCGFCTVGFVVSLSSFCLAAKKASYVEAIASIDGNICRCTGYKSIERAAEEISHQLQDKDIEFPIQWLVKKGFIPPYFNVIFTKLLGLKSDEIIEDAKKLIGGGTDLYVQRPDDLVELEVDLISQISWLKGIVINDETCKIGAGSTITELMESCELQNILPSFNTHMKLVSSSPIRNISTLGGNFVNASPIGDLTACFIALNSKIELISDKGSREMYLKNFYKGYKELDINDGEIIESVSFKVPCFQTRFNFEKVSTRIHLDIASVNSAISITVIEGVIEEINISAGGIGPIPTYLNATCKYLQGKFLDPGNVKLGNSVLQEEIKPISDVRGTEQYKRVLLRQLYFAHFITLFPNLFSLESLL